MKNVQKIAVFVFAAFALMSTRASVLYWQVEAGSASESFQYARLMATGGDLATPTAVGGAQAEGTAPNQYVSLQNTELGQYGNDSYSFFVEMANYNNGTWENVATGQTISYTDLVSSGYVATGAIDANTAAANASNFNMGAAGDVPEPSSGLLLLVGGAMLALRRRRQK